MSIDNTILYREISQAFRQTLANANGEYVPRPPVLGRLGSAKRGEILELRGAGDRMRERLNAESDGLTRDYGISRLDAVAICADAYNTERKLVENGVMFGERPFNFSISRVEIPEAEINKAYEISNAYMKAIQCLASRTDYQPDSDGMNSVETRFEELKLQPNASRLDFLLTDRGPLLIEANCQWVDAIAALAGFQQVSGLSPSARKTIASFCQSFPQRSKLAILDISQTRGSRQIGAELELSKLAEDVRSRAGNVVDCEVLDPQKTRIEYLRRFNAFYVNCDPKAFVESTPPDWVKYLLERVKSNKDCMFPKWRPSMDKKTILPFLSGYDPRYTDQLMAAGVNVDLLFPSVVPTWQLSDVPNPNGMVIKGDGFSTREVSLPGMSGYEEFLNYAKANSRSYVAQPYVQGRRFNAWVYDTSRNKVRYIEDAYSKLNIWWLNGKVVGSLVTLSESPMISDKGYNCIPKIIK